MRSLIKIFLMMCCFVIIAYHNAQVAHASMEETCKWSFNFGDHTISETLKIISKETGIQIYINKSFDEKIISKSYRKSSIKEIITDLFHKENYAIVWSYSGSRLDVIEILTVEGGSGGSIFKSANSFNRKRIGVKDDNTRKNNHKTTLAQSNYQKSNIANYSLQFKPASYLEESKAAVPSENSTLGAFRNRTILFSSGNNTSNSGIEETTDDEGVGALPPPSIPEGGNNMEQELNLDTPPPVPEKWHGLEPPPMPPGFSGTK